MPQPIRDFVRALLTGAAPEGGQAMVEYALLIAFIAAVAVVAVVVLGNSVSSLFNSLSGSL